MEFIEHFEKNFVDELREARGAAGAGRLVLRPFHFEVDAARPIFVDEERVHHWKVGRRKRGEISFIFFKKREKNLQKSPRWDSFSKFRSKRNSNLLRSCRLLTSRVLFIDWLVIFQMAADNEHVGTVARRPPSARILAEFRQHEKRFRLRSGNF